MLIILSKSSKALSKQILLIFQQKKNDKRARRFKIKKGGLMFHLTRGAFAVMALVAFACSEDQLERAKLESTSIKVANTENSNYEDEPQVSSNAVVLEEFKAAAPKVLLA